MKTDGQTLRENELVIPYVDLESVKEWTKRTFTKERIADVVVYVSTVAILGMSLHMLHIALQNYTIAGL